MNYFHLKSSQINCPIFRLFQLLCNDKFIVLLLHFLPNILLARVRMHIWDVFLCCEQIARASYTLISLNSLFFLPRTISLLKWHSQIIDLALKLLIVFGLCHEQIHQFIILCKLTVNLFNVALQACNFSLVLLSLHLVLILQIIHKLGTVHCLIIIILVSNRTVTSLDFYFTLILLMHWIIFCTKNTIFSNSFHLMS